MKTYYMAALLLLVPLVYAHTDSSGAHVRVVSSNPDTLTYTFSCYTDTETGYLRDFFIRPDNGSAILDLPNEAEGLDRAPGNHFTYTFQTNRFYHVGCIIVNNTNGSHQWRGDLHIDLRPSANWNPQINVVSNPNNLTSTLQCEYSGSGTKTWEVLNAQTHQVTNLGTENQITHSVPDHGIYDYFCSVDGKKVPLPVEYFDSGAPYYPDKSGVPHGIFNIWNRNTTNIPPTNNTNTTPPTNNTNTTPPSNATCFSNVQNIPASCTGGSITQDAFNGCRTIQCTNGASNMQILACDKPSVTNPAFFEMYKQSQTGSLVSQICIGATCISNNGYAKSQNYPICTTNTTTPPTNTTNTTNTTNNPPIISNGQPTGSLPAGTTSTTMSVTTNEAANCKFSNVSSTAFVAMTNFSSSGNLNHITPLSGLANGQTYNRYVQCQDTQGATTPNDYVITFSVANTSSPLGNTTACFSALQNMPVNCTGTITSDTFNGCRTIACSSGANNIQILACEKPSNTNPEYFEMYRQIATSNPPRICIGLTCMQSEGYQQSGHYPICMSTQPPVCTPTTEVCDTIDNDCDGLIDETNVCQPTQTCYNNVQTIPASCTGGSITQDSFNGCRTIQCVNGASSMQILACDKADNTFEMYKQSQAGTLVSKICIANTCISDNGFAKSSLYPICVQGSGNNSSNSSSSFVWIEPTQNQLDTSPTFFHLNIQVPSNEVQIPSTDWEVWDNAMTERVWNAHTIGSLRFHTHTPDGTFEGSSAGPASLGFSSTYRVRIHYNFNNGSTSPWSDWRTFTTSAQPASNQSGNLTWTTVSGFKVEPFATDFDAPVHIAFPPQNMYNAFPQNQRPYFYVTELYGKVKVVYKNGSQSTYAENLLNFDPFSSITGGGQMGVIGLYVDEVTGDLFVGTVYVVNDTVKNKIIKFTTSNDGKSSLAQQTILDNLPSAPSHQIEEITKGPDGLLYVQLGDALNENNAQSDTILAGKIIRMNLDGSNVEVYAKGLRNPFGGDWRPGTSQLFVTDNSPNTNDRLLKINQGENYLWGTGTNEYVSKAIALLNPSPVDVEFNPGNAGFPEALTGKLYVAVAGPIYQQGQTHGKEIIEYTLNSAGNVTSSRQFMHYTGNGYGTPIGLDFGPDGLYFSDIYGEAGFVGLGETEGVIYRISEGNATPCTNCSGEFRAAISIAPWYPKDTGSGIEYVFDCRGLDGSGNYLYDWNFGNGQQQFNYNQNRIGPKTYPYGDQDYTITCVAKDQSTVDQRPASLIINPSDFIQGQ